jgi:hypothetical protein
MMRVFLPLSLAPIVVLRFALVRTRGLSVHNEEIVRARFRFAGVTFNRSFLLEMRAFMRGLCQSLITFANYLFFFFRV